MKYITTLLLALSFLVPSLGSFHPPLLAQDIESVGEFENRYDVFLKKYNHDGLVDYASLKDDDSDLVALLEYIAKVDLELSNQENKATLINAYNLSVIAAVVSYYPISSPLDRKDFFTNKTARVGGKELSLDELEKQIIFKKYPDFRLHFALVCAAVGCPKLADKAFRASTLEQQLETATQNSIRSDVLLKYSASQNTLSLSELFSWYLEDFGGSEKELLKLIKKYSDRDIPDKVKIDFMKYNWLLNSK